MNRRDILRNMAAGTGIAFTSTTASASVGDSENSPNLDSEVLSGFDELVELSEAWYNTQELRDEMEQQYGLEFSRSDGSSKRIKNPESENELTLTAFQSGLDSLGSNPDDSRHVLIIRTKENGDPNDPYAVIEGMASDFDEIPNKVLEDPGFSDSIGELDVSEEEAMSSHVSVVRIHKGDTQTTFFNVHSNQHEYGLLVEQAVNNGEEKLSTAADTQGSDIIYASEIHEDSEGATTMNHGGGDLMDCIKEAPLGATAAACIASCVNAQSLIGAAACAGCGCYAGCWAGSCAKHVSSGFCATLTSQCAISNIMPPMGVPDAGSCCVVFGCHFDCAWVE